MTLMGALHLPIDFSMLILDIACEDQSAKVWRIFRTVPIGCITVVYGSFIQKSYADSQVLVI